MRKFNLELSEDYSYDLMSMAGKYNMTVSELLEHFIKDLVNYYGGYDRTITDDHGVELAREWADYRLSCYQNEKNIVSFLCGRVWKGAGYDWAQYLTYVYSHIKESIAATLDELAHMEKLQENDYFEHWENLLQNLENEQRGLLSIEEDLEDLKKCFADYMGDQEYSWEAEYEKFEKWYKAESTKFEWFATPLKAKEEARGTKKSMEETLDALNDPEDSKEDDYTKSECTTEEHSADLQQGLESDQDDLLYLKEKMKDLEEKMKNLEDGLKKYMDEVDQKYLREAEQEEAAPKKLQMAWPRKSRSR